MAANARADAAGAVDDDRRGLVGQPALDLRLEVAAGDVHGARDRALVVLVGLADVEDDRAVGDALGGGPAVSTSVISALAADEQVTEGGHARKPTDLVKNSSLRGDRFSAPPPCHYSRLMLSLSRRTRRVATAIVLTASVLATTLVTGDLAAAPAPGSNGAGDAYFPKYGNGGYDVREYDISVRFNPSTERLNGKTIVTLRAKRDLSSFNLDLVLPASRVAVNGVDAAFRSGRHELRITPDRPLRSGQTARVAVTYAGVLKDVVINGVSPWITTPDGAVVLGEPEIVAWWFPANDHPTDKARYRVQIRVPAGKEAISGGTFKGRATRAGWTTWKWELGAQTASYLVFAAIGDYDIESGVAPSGRKYFHAFGTGVGSTARNSIRWTDQATPSSPSGSGYPFGPIGGVAPLRRIGFAFETQTRPVYKPGFFAGGRHSLVVTHEMAHQWFGDRSRSPVEAHLAERGVRHVHGAGSLSSTLGRSAAFRSGSPSLSAAARFPAGNPLGI